MKTCTKCEKQYPATTKYFFAGSGYAGGLRSKCKTCMAGEVAARRRENKSTPNADELIKKTCSKCLQDLPATLKYFFAEKNGKYGLRSKCKACFYSESKKLKSKPSYLAKAKDYRLKHYRKNRDKYALRWREYYAKNKATLIAKSIDRYRSDPVARLHQNVSRAIRSSLSYGTKRRKKWESLVGYTTLDLKQHLEKQFKPGMTWENYGEWHIDHIIPVAVFNFGSYEHEDFKRCWALKNLQPMWAKENISKGARLETHFQPALQLAV